MAGGAKTSRSTANQPQKNLWGRLGAFSLILATLVLSSWGCTFQNRTPGQIFQQIRPSTDTARLVQNAAYLRKSGRLALAVEELEEAHLQEPGNLKILDVLIQCYEELGHFDRAQELYKEAMSRAGHHPALANNRCYSLYLQGRLGQAEACFRKVLARQPDNQTARNNLGLVLCRQGREAEALAMWREALSDAKARQRLGQALAALGQEVQPSLAGPTVVAEAYAGQQPPLHPDAGAGLTHIKQPPAAPAATEAASVQLARWAPHPSADAAPGTEPSPRMPAPKTVPPRQKPVDEATSVRAVPPPVAVPSSLPVAESGRRRDGTPTGRTTWLTAVELISTKVEVKNGNGRRLHARETRSLLWGEGYNVVDISNHMDFGVEQTVISCRFRAKRVAQVLARDFFPEAHIQNGAQLPAGVDIRVTLGQDLLQREEALAKLAD